MHLQKQCLVLGATPADWNAGWAFPGPNPPGWPKRMPQDFRFTAAYRDGRELHIGCFDSYNEPTDLMVGQMFEITASGERGGLIRMRSSENQVWSRKVLVNITAPHISIPLQFEAENLGGERGMIRVELFGHNDGGVVTFAQVPLN